MILQSYAKNRMENRGSWHLKILRIKGFFQDLVILQGFT